MVADQAHLDHVEIEDDAPQNVMKLRWTWPPNQLAAAGK
jgi:hypothetical protein